ncbi:hypothetical protein FG94_04935 [Massilia sp. LC238]|nr:hypothetical protein FG94_04935 [Massilia sp. LC238]
MQVKITPRLVTALSGLVTASAGFVLALERSPVGGAYLVILTTLFIIGLAYRKT